jgi:3-deoxy-manno-octulosonate cytidylyltransferase (CMP-KDO synthetase)
MKKILGVIPARLRSTRLAEKLLLPINGKPLLYYTWRQALRAKRLGRVIIATDSEKIRRAAEAFGAEVVMTSVLCPTGSDRVAEAARAFKGFIPTIVVNIQGDEPLISPAAIDACVDSLLKNRAIPMATVASPLSPFEARKDSVVKVVCDARGRALYFSRTVIPYPRIPHDGYLRHIGLYAFRLHFLFVYVGLSQTPLEIAESLEQLRALEHGYGIQVAVGEFKTIGVDTRSDFLRVKKIISHAG